GDTDGVIEPRDAAVAIGGARLAYIACNCGHFPSGCDHSNSGAGIICHEEISILIHRHVSGEVEARIDASAIRATLLSGKSGEVGEPVILTGSQEGRGG